MPDIQLELSRHFAAIGWVLVVGAALFFLKVILAIVIKGRVSPGRAPGLSDLQAPDFMTRILALVGHRARVPETLGTVRLRPTLGLQIAYWGGFALLVYVATTMKAPVVSIESVISLVVLITALHTSLYEISFDRDTITLPRWWFGRTTHRWSDLLAVSERDKWFIAFSFERGTVVRAHKYIVGYDRLMDTARQALRAT